jgi:hypothetical protein
MKLALHQLIRLPGIYILTGPALLALLALFSVNGAWLSLRQCATGLTWRWLRWCSYSIYMPD